MMKKITLSLLIYLLSFSLSGCSNFLGVIDGGIKKDPKITFTSKLIEIKNSEIGGDGTERILTGWQDTYEIPDWKLRFTASVGGGPLYSSFYGRHEDSDFYFSGNRLFRVFEKHLLSGGIVKRYDAGGAFIGYFSDMGDKTIDDFKKEGEVVKELGFADCSYDFDIVDCEKLVAVSKGEKIEDSIQTVTYFFKPGERDYYLLFDGGAGGGWERPEPFEKIEFFHK